MKTSPRTQPRLSIFARLYGCLFCSYKIVLGKVSPNLPNCQTRLHFTMSLLKFRNNKFSVNLLHFLELFLAGLTILKHILCMVLQIFHLLCACYLLYLLVLFAASCTKKFCFKLDRLRVILSSGNPLVRRLARQLLLFCVNLRSVARVDLLDGLLVQ